MRKPSNTANLVFGEPRERAIIPQDGLTAIGPIEFKPNRIAVVPARDADGNETYHCINKSGLHWKIGPSTGKKYDNSTHQEKPGQENGSEESETKPKRKAQSARKRTATFGTSVGRATEGTDTGGDGSRERGPGGGTDEPPEESPASE